MRDIVHYSIWNSINELYPTDIEYKDGVQNYLQYCADNSITKEYLNKQTNFNTPDIMKYFNGLAFQETMTYRGYVIKAGDTNFDNQKERIEQEYKEIIGYEEKVYNDKLKILKTGFRKDEPIALVEKDVPDMKRKEYIVAFNYVIDEEKNNLTWGYGRYYYDKNSGEKAYEKVINGGNLAFHDLEER